MHPPSRCAAVVPWTHAAALAALAALLAACGPEQGAPAPGAEGVITGSVLHRERIALPADATVTVRLEDVSIADAPAVALAEQTIATNGRQVPIPFELRYPPERIRASGRYGVRAEIRSAGGELMFTTTSHHGVLEGGAAPERDIEIVVERARAAGAATGSITGGPWRLVAIRRPGAAEEAVPAEPAYTIELGADGRYSGQAHCNRYLGSYERPGPGELRMRGGAATLAACPAPSLADEYLRAVAAVSRHSVSGDELRLAYGSGGELVFARESARAAAAPEVGRTFVYDCAGDLSFTVRTGPGEVALWAPESLGGAYTVLSASPPESTERYEESGTVAILGAESATFEIGGQRYADCASNPAKVPWADAKRRGATFRALGNEPAWNLEIFPDRLVMVTNLGADRTELAHDGPTVDGARTTYRAAVGESEITAVIERRACTDTMSGEPFGTAVTVTFGEETLCGCGRFL